MKATLEAEMERNEALYNLRREALEAQLALLEEAGKGQTREALKIQKELLKNQKDYNTQLVENEKRTADLKKKVQKESLQASSTFLELGIELLVEMKRLERKMPVLSRHLL